MLLAEVNVMGEPVRILQVVTDMNRGGLETMIMNYYRSIDRSRVQFDFLVHRSKKAAYDDEILSMGGKIYSVPKLNPFSNGYKKSLNEFFQTHKEYRVIHVHQDCLSSVILKAAKKNNVSVRIAHSHSSSQDKNIKYLLKLFYMRSIPKYATELFACSKAAGDWMFKGCSYKVVANAIDAERFTYDANLSKQVRSELGIEEGDFVIGHVGRFSRVKNHTFLLDIFNEILKMNGQAKLIFVGSGDLEESIREKANSLKIAENVFFLGDRNDVYRVLQAVDVFVLPSLYEGLPVTLVEVQASGLKFIISDKVPVQSILINKLGKVISLDESPESWAGQILDFVSGYKREDTYKEICNAGFDIKSSAHWLQNYYLEKYNNLKEE